MAYKIKKSCIIDSAKRLGYRATRNGVIIDPVGFFPHLLSLPSGHVQFSVLHYGRACLAHRFVWAYFNGEIPEGFRVRHINRVRDDNRLSNLQCLSRPEYMACEAKAKMEERERWANE